MSRNCIFVPISKTIGVEIGALTTSSPMLLLPYRTDSERLDWIPFLTLSSHTPSQFQSPGRRVLASEPTPLRGTVGLDRSGGLDTGDWPSYMFLLAGEFTLRYVFHACQALRPKVSKTNVTNEIVHNSLLDLQQPSAATHQEQIHLRRWPEDIPELRG